MVEVERLCERVIILKKGRIEDDGTPAALLAPMGVTRSRTSFLMSRVAAPAPGWRCHDQIRFFQHGGHFPSGPPVSWRRIAAMVTRYWYFLRSSWPRLLELSLARCPTADVGVSPALSGAECRLFRQGGRYFHRRGAVWDILFRGQLGFSISFFEEMWSRNLANLMMSPLRPSEFVLAMMTMSIVRLLLGMVPVSLLAIGFFGFNLYSIGFALAAFFVNLILTSWAVGIFVSGFGDAQRARRREPRLVDHVFVDAAYLRVLPGRGHATLAAARRVVAAADLCVRRDARAAIDHVFRGDLMLRVPRHECHRVFGRGTWVHAAFEVARRNGTLMQTGE